MDNSVRVLLEIKKKRKEKEDEYMEGVLKNVAGSRNGKH